MMGASHRSINKIIIVFLLIFYLFPFVFPQSTAAVPKKHSSPVSLGKKIKIFREFDGFLETVTKGVGMGRPPYIKVFPSKKGLFFQLEEFKKIRNRHTNAKVDQLARDLEHVDFNSQMVIAIFTFPTDNYDLSLSEVTNTGNMIEVRLAYSHKNLAYQILPDLKIYYKFLIAEKTNLPVLLKATPAYGPQKKRISKSTLQSVFGILKQWENVESAMGLVTKVQGKEFIYYIREPEWIESLKPFIGQSIGVRGEIMKEEGNIYEAEIKVKEIIKASKSSRESR